MQSIIEDRTVDVAANWKCGRKGEWQLGKNIFDANNACDTTLGAVNQDGEIITIERVVRIGHDMRGSCPMSVYPVLVRAYLFVRPLFINLFIFWWNMRCSRHGTDVPVAPQLHTLHTRYFLVGNFRRKYGGKFEAPFVRSTRFEQLLRCVGRSHGGLFIVCAMHFKSNSRLCHQSGKTRHPFNFHPNRSNPMWIFHEIRNHSVAIHSIINDGSE